MNKIGIDSNIIIKLMEAKDQIEERYIFTKEDAFFMHSLCLWEIHDWLAKKGMSAKDAELETEDFIKKHKITLINKDHSKEEIAEFEAKCHAKGIDCHHPDSTIILAFNAEGIEAVYSEDKAFRDACRLLDVKALRFPMP